MKTSSTHSVHQVAAFTFLSWLGGYLHHRFELPQLILLSPEHMIPIIVSTILFLAWWQLPFKRLAAFTLLVWAFFPQLLGGGILSVLPLEFWPFDPPQTLEHYLVHVLYALAQLPLIVAIARQLKLSDRSRNLTGAKV